MNALNDKDEQPTDANVQVNENNMLGQSYRGDTGLKLGSILGASSDILKSLQEDKKADV